MDLMQLVFDTIVAERQDKAVLTKLSASRSLESDQLIHLAANYMGKTQSAKGSSKPSMNSRPFLTSKSKEERSDHRSERRI